LIFPLISLILLILPLIYDDFLMMIKNCIKMLDLYGVFGIYFQADFEMLDSYGVF
jgi:hypothetical protein